MGGREGSNTSYRLIHERSPLPQFVEKFTDDGYFDMWKIMTDLRDADFDGIVILDDRPRRLPGAG
jgi:hypothetical protein